MSYVYVCFDVILDHFIFIQSLCTAVFLSSLFEFILLHKNRWYAFLQRHCSASDDVALETGVTGVPDDNTSPTEPGQFQMSEIAAVGTIGAYVMILYTYVRIVAYIHIRIQKHLPMQTHLYLRLYRYDVLDLKPILLYHY